MNYTIFYYFVVVLIFLLSCATNSSSLDCYLCVGSLASDCAKRRQEAFVPIRCGPSSIVLQHHLQADQNELKTDTDTDNALAQSCVDFEQPMPGGEKAIVRGCAVLPSSVEPCNFIEKKLKATNCRSCNTTLCNGRT